MHLLKVNVQQLLFLIVLAIFVISPLSSKINDPEFRNGSIYDIMETRNSKDEERSEEYHNINLYLKDDLSLDTAPPLNNTPSIIRLIDGDSVEFVSLRPLYGNLPVMGDTVGTENCFEISVTTIYTGNADASITIKILDGQTEIASSTFSDEEFRSNPKKIFYIPEAAPERTYTFQKDNHIRIKMNVSIEDGPGPVLDRVVTVSYDSTSTNTDSHLILFSQQIREITLDTYKDDVKTTDFEPNLPDSKRHLDVKGDVINIMGDYDIRAIEVIILDPEHVPIGNVSADIHTGEEDDRVSFIARWEYDTGHPAGTYTVRLVVTDNSMNTVNSTLIFTMVRYGVYLTCDEYEKWGMAGSKVSIMIIVRNTGDREDIFTLEKEVVPSFWSASMDEEITVSGGTMETAELVATVPVNAKEGDVCSIDVTATSLNAPDIEGSLPRSIKITAITQYMFTAELTGDSEKQVDNGNTVSYRFKVENVGDKDDSIIIEVPQPPRDWTAEMEKGMVKISPNGSYPRIYLLELPQGEEKTISLEITAPDAPTDNTRAELMIRFTSQNESLMTRSVTTITTTPTIVEERLELTSGKSEGTSEYDADGGEFEPVRFDLEILNPGPREWQAVIDIAHDNDYSDWEVDILDTLKIPPGSKKSFTVEIVPPEDEPATEQNEKGGKFTVSAQVIGAEGQVLEDTAFLFVRVGKFYSFSFKVTGRSDTSVSKPGKESTFQLELSNQGNGIDEIRLEHDDASNWGIKFSAEKVSIESGATETVTVTVVSPKDSEDGDVNRISLIAIRDGNEIKRVSIEVMVEIGVKEHFATLMRDGVFWMIMGLFAVVVFLFFRTRRTLKKD